MLAVVGCPNLPPAGVDPETHADGPGYLFCATPTWAGSLDFPAVEGLLAGSVAWPEAMQTLRVDSSETPVVTESISAPVVTESISQFRKYGSFWVDFPYLKGWRVCRVDSMVKYLLVARGDFHVYFRGTPLSPSAGHDSGIWDHVGALMVTAAGGRVTNYQGETLNFGEGRKLLRNGGVLATHGALHDDILASIRELAG